MKQGCRPNEEVRVRRCIAKGSDGSLTWKLKSQRISIGDYEEKRERASGAEIRKNN